MRNIVTGRPAARKLVKAALAAAMAAAAIVVPSSMAFANPTYYVTSTNGVYARTGPHQADISGYGPGYLAPVTYICYGWGDAVGPNNRLWYLVQWSGGQTWISDHWLSDPEPANTPVPGVGECGPAPQPAPAATTAAIDWARQHLGQNFDDGECLLFVAQAFASAGINIGGAPGAAQYWSEDPRGYQEHPGDTSPVPGSLVFWGATSSNSYGHVGIFENNNTVISTSSWPEPYSNPDVHEFSFSGRNSAGYPYLGWMSVS